MFTIFAAASPQGRLVTFHFPAVCSCAEWLCLAVFSETFYLQRDRLFRASYRDRCRENTVCSGMRGEKLLNSDSHSLNLKDWWSVVTADDRVSLASSATHCRCSAVIHNKSDIRGIDHLNLCVCCVVSQFSLSSRLLCCEWRVASTVDDVAFVFANDCWLSRSDDSTRVPATRVSYLAGLYRSRSSDVRCCIISIGGAHHFCSCGVC